MSSGGVVALGFNNPLRINIFLTVAIGMVAILDLTNERCLRVDATCFKSIRIFRSVKRRFFAGTAAPPTAVVVESAGLGASCGTDGTVETFRIAPPFREDVEFCGCLIGMRGFLRVAAGAAAEIRFFGKSLAVDGMALSVCPPFLAAILTFWPPPVIGFTTTGAAGVGVADCCET